MNISSEDILIRAMRTPNPLAIKLIVNFPLKTEGKASFTKQEGLSHTPPLFSNLFNIPGVHQVHVFENQITLSHEGTIDFEEIEKQAVQTIKNFGADHNADFSVPEEEKKKKDRSQLSEMHRKAEEILDRTIRPGLQADGGDLEIVSFKNNKVEIAYEGACGGCPSSYMGTLDAIENILRYELQNENIEVYPV